MGYFNDLSIDTRTCGEAALEAAQDRRDGISHTQAQTQVYTVRALTTAPGATIQRNGVFYSLCDSIDQAEREAARLNRQQARKSR